VRVDDDGVGTLDPLPGPAELRADHRRAGIGRVDVEPDMLALADLRQLRNRVDRGRRGRPNRCDQSARALEIVEILGSHPELVVRRNLLDRKPE